MKKKQQKQLKQKSLREQFHESMFNEAKAKACCFASFGDKPHLEPLMLGSSLLGVTDREFKAISELMSCGWTIQLDSKLDIFGLKRKGV